MVTTNFQHKNTYVRNVLESPFTKFGKHKKKPPKPFDLGGSLVAEAGLEPTTSGLWERIFLNSIVFLRF